MKKIFSIVLFLLVLLFIPLAVYAQSPTPYPPVVLPKTTIVNHDYFGVGPTVDMEGTVNGDAYLAGGTVLMNGTVNGDVLAAGGQVTINGTAHNIRIAGGQVIINGTVNGNVTVAGGNVTFTTGSHIAGSVVGAGGQMLMSSPITKTVNVAGGQITIANTVAGDVSVAAGQFILTPDAKLARTLWYQSQQPAQIENGAAVAGKITHTIPPQPERPAAPFAFFVGINLFASFAMFVIELVIGLLLISLLPNYTKRVVTFMRQKVWWALGMGILAWIITPFALLLLAVTLIGIPLAVVLLFFVFIASYVGRILAAVFFGNWLVRLTNRKQVNMFVALLVGLIAVEIISWIPILGGLFAFVLTAIGFGAVLILERDYYIELRAKKVI